MKYALLEIMTLEDKLNFVQNRLKRKRLKELLNIEMVTNMEMVTQIDVDMWKQKSNKLYATIIRTIQ